MSSLVQVVFCDVVQDPLHSVNGKLFCLGAPFLWYL